jgi:hypothetical protein
VLLKHHPRFQERRLSGEQQSSDPARRADRFATTAIACIGPITVVLAARSGRHPDVTALGAEVGSGQVVDDALETSSVDPRNGQATAGRPGKRPRHCCRVEALGTNQRHAVGLIAGPAQITYGIAVMLEPIKEWLNKRVPAIDHELMKV